AIILYFIFSPFLLQIVFIYLYYNLLYLISSIEKYFHQLKNIFITTYKMLRHLILSYTKSWGTTLSPNKIKQAIFALLFQKNEAKFHTTVGELKFPNSLPNFYPIPCINSDNLR
ncbi:hypothetical protein DWV67_12225, partial [Dorea formicigenerans]